MYITINVGNEKTIIAFFEDYTIESKTFDIELETIPLYKENKKKIFKLIKENLGDQKIEGIGIAHSGDLDEKREKILLTSHLENFIEQNTVQDLKNEFGVEVYMENDSICAALAELYFGKAQDSIDVASIYLSSGIGGSYIKRFDKILSVFPADIGHQIIELNGKICDCGQRGCLEAYVGAKAIRKRFLVEQKELTDLRIWEDIVELIAIGAVNMYNMFYPKTIVLCGETLDQVAYVKESLGSRIKERVSSGVANDFDIVISDFGKYSPTYGALGLLKLRSNKNTLKFIQ